MKKNWVIETRRFMLEHFFQYPTNMTLGYLWSFGSLAGLCLMMQIVTGLLLAMHYLPSAEMAFFTVEQISREVNYGWLFSYAHSNGASFFFIVLYIHIFSSLFTASYSKNWMNAWVTGVMMFMLIIATAFFGYVLPWGQMSLWGATVITNLFSAVPMVGNSLVLWLWGGFTVDTPTIGKFFTLHFLLPFIMALLALLHILFIHEKGSSSQLSSICVRDQKYFLSYFAVKDLLGCMYLVTMLGIFVIYAPNLLGHPDNYIEANHMITPLHMVPEWYFLPFYAILRSVPDKLSGVMLMFGSLLSLLVFPFIQIGSGVRHKTSKGEYLPMSLLTNNQSSQWNSFHLFMVTYFSVVFVLLGWLGGKPAVEPFTTVSLWLSIAYFVLLFIGRSLANHWHSMMFDWLVERKFLLEPNYKLKRL